MTDVLLSYFLKISLLLKGTQLPHICNHQIHSCTHYAIFICIFHSHLLMVLTINRGYLCFSHPPVIISTDLIFLFFFFLPAEPSWKNMVTKWRHHSGWRGLYVYDDSGYGHFCLNRTGRPHITGRYLTMWICFFFVRNMDINKQFGDKSSFDCLTEQQYCRCLDYDLFRW